MLNKICFKIIINNLSLLFAGNYQIINCHRKKIRGQCFKENEEWEVGYESIAITKLTVEQK